MFYKHLLMIYRVVICHLGDIGGNASGICGDMPCLCAISPQHQRGKGYEKLLCLFHSDYLTLKSYKYFYSFTPSVRSGPVWGGSNP